MAQCWQLCVTTGDLQQLRDGTSQNASPRPTLTTFPTLLSSRAVVQTASEFSDHWIVLPLRLGSDGQLFLFGDKILQISQGHPVKHLQGKRGGGGWEKRKYPTN